jgi:hypothetical protein
MRWGKETMDFKTKLYILKYNDVLYCFNTKNLYCSISNLKFLWKILLSLVTSIAVHAEVLMFKLCLLQTRVIFHWDKSRYIPLFHQLQISNIWTAYKRIFSLFTHHCTTEDERRQTEINVMYEANMGKNQTVTILSAYKRSMCTTICGTPIMDFPLF